MARFTAANAALMAAKSHAARRQRPASGEPAGETFPQTPQRNLPQAADLYHPRSVQYVRGRKNQIPDGRNFTGCAFCASRGSQ